MITGAGQRARGTLLPGPIDWRPWGPPRPAFQHQNVSSAMGRIADANPNGVNVSFWPIADFALARDHVRSCPKADISEYPIDRSFE